MHTELEVAPTLKSYEKLLIFCCDLRKVYAALDLVDQICREGLTLSIDMLNSILLASDAVFEFNLGQRIYSLICQHNLIPNSETFRSMISLRAKMKDFGGAYDLLNDVKKLKLTPTASMYNAIMVAYFREKNINGALTVLKKMEQAEVRPDSQTYSYLIANCDSEDQIIKYYEELKVAGISVTKQIFMALINSYATCGQFEKAKLVLLEKGIPIKNLNEIKSVLVSALASHGQLCDALDLYEEIKEAGKYLEPKSVICLIVFSIFAEAEPSQLHIGLELLQALKNELCVTPSRKSLDFLLSACGRAKDLRNSHLIWKEYKAAGYPYNVASYLRMYQALLASGDCKSAKLMLANIPKDDLHVYVIIEACQKAYNRSKSAKGKNKKNKSKKTQKKEPKVK
uniref:PROP1-like PPR domain-containing protein n=1 Tax=Manihot esculenta TaxID=3983 RepID=A0A2C9W6R3_MANES